MFILTKKVLTFVRIFTNSMGIKSITTDKQIRTARYAKPMGHPIRMFVLEPLLNRICCYSGHLNNELKIAKSTLSLHLKELKDAELIQGEVEYPGAKYCINKKRWEDTQQLFKQFWGI